MVYNNFAKVMRIRIKRIKTHPLPTPATYPKGAGTPKKCFLFRVFREAEGTAILTVFNTLKPVLHPEFPGSF